MTVAKRVIARLDIKAPNLIKGIHLEGLRVIGAPQEYALDYYQQGADELIYLDIVASLYGRNGIFELVKNTVQNVFIPLTAGGGIRTLHDVEKMLHSGADKVAVNTAAIKNPHFISEVAKQFGSQCFVLSVEAKRVSPTAWEAYTDNGREHTEQDVVRWCQQAQDLGAGEILLTSIDQEGTKKGFDIGLIKAVTSAVSIPVIASGGCGHIEHGIDAFNDGDASAIAIADMLHYKRASIQDFKQTLQFAGHQVRL
ncbi:HisA/HisF-related TIM barrel protein [Candidatus Berkiella aquae]|uniref:imidazole glycerol-phosphate synthase n=1 Tax=Candidatus Berkiella aquae TaxID=295108 RepID=A0A0Q9YTX1_9GAMM|nr:imidazole glycerol phosphate synthase cyclase subunit [Candidatus Berkiella aquae]MCS5712330.1 imidazole glycerol phosphate synthase cyclase subunit [Candidatus Berkiella aquae]